MTLLDAVIDEGTSASKTGEHGERVGGVRDAYGPELYENLVEATYEHVYESYWGEGKSKYEGGAP